MAKKQGRISGAAARTRSGLQRYPKQIFESLTTPPPEIARGNGLETFAAPGRRDGADATDTAAAPGLAAAWLGHATVLLRVGGMNILTDPVFSHRIGFAIGPLTIGVSRLTPAPLHPHDLPPIDLVLLSHAHFDHFDRPSLRQLARSHTAVVTARGTRRLVPRGFGEVIELDWSHNRQIGLLTLSAVRPAHWGARAAIDRHRRFNSYLIRAPSPEGGRTVLFAGDTAMTDVFDTLGPVDLAMLGIGAYGGWEHRHATPEQAWSMFRAVKGAHLLPMHHSTFPLGHEHVDEPMARLLTAAGEEGGRVICRQLGEVWTLPGGEAGPGPTEPCP